MAEVVFSSVLEEALKQVSDRVAKKLAEGKKLSDTEVIILLLDLMNKRMDEMSRRIGDMNLNINKRIDDLYAKLSQRIDDVEAKLS